MGLFGFFAKKRKQKRGRISSIKKEPDLNLYADSSSIPEYEKKYYQADEYYPIIAFRGTSFERRIIPFEERKKTSTTTKNGLYAAEILLLEYCTFGSYPHPQRCYPGHWWFEYGIRDVGGALRSLEKRGFIRLKTAKESLPRLTVPQLKEILSSVSLSTVGPKSDLINRINNVLSEEELLRYVNKRRYVLTPLGERELEDHKYIVDARKNGEYIHDIRTPGSVYVSVSRTRNSYVTTQNQVNRYKSAGIECYIFLGTLDLTICPKCAKLDMKRFPLSNAKAGINLPPMHPGCRCTTMPDIDKETLAKIKRFARDPVTGKSTTVPGTMSYWEWYEKYVQGNPEAEANEKIEQNREKDKQQYDEILAVLGGRAPQSLVSFQRMKYKETDNWDVLLTAYKKYIQLGITPYAKPMSTGNIFLCTPSEELIIDALKDTPGILQKDLTNMLKNNGIPHPLAIINALVREGFIIKIRAGKTYRLYAVEDAPVCES